MSLEKLSKMNGVLCSCGKVHSFASAIYTGSGILGNIPQYLHSYRPKKLFVLCDQNTYRAAGESVCQILTQTDFSYTLYIFPDQGVEPDEFHIGSVITHFDTSCDMIIAIGSGVINDIGKILSSVTKLPYMIVATAPSMDGYASASSSITRDGLKISLPTRSADIIIGDTQVLCNAPMEMMRSGLGDMIAKYVSICEWRIAALVTGEYYCEEIAQLIRSALKACVDNAAGLLNRDETAVAAVFEGLVIGGVAMNYAGLSRPASGVEHYISHILDMRSVEFGTPAQFHGIQCAIGTLIAVRLYEKLKTITPDKEKACQYAKLFDFTAWSEDLRALLGKGAKTMILQEQTDKKYDSTLHSKRLDVIIDNWDHILKAIDDELPTSQALETLLDTIEAPKSLKEIGIDEKDLPMIFQATKDIRDKYVLSRLLWDLGLLDEFFQSKG